MATRKRAFLISSVACGTPVWADEQLVVFSLEMTGVEGGRSVRLAAESMDYRREMQVGLYLALLSLLAAPEVAKVFRSL
jgi:hypothetical protein